ncbi:hypothetical protein H4R20_005529 [Coemansia guatemalensis]|uniref:FCP1 homology domain-containing protein n=1 Tax=Coemansia guatemalensis TaxID=2761395 RepID=A0A9W8HXQ8_9FUNG|nr:hypothetical protein H4R20_005529 [Coemansia guatemalensis]
MVCTRLVERGQLLLSRAHSSSRKNGRQERVLSSQNDSSATALQSNAAADATSSTRATSSRPSPAAPVPAPSQHNNKGAADFRLQGLRCATPPAALTNSLPVINRHGVEDAVTEAPPARPIHRQRRAKLIRDPTNTCHRPRNHPSRLTQSMDFERSPRAEQRRNVLSQLFTCCTPVTGLFRRGTSYGTMQSDANRQSSSEQQHQPTRQLSEEEEGARQRLSSNDDYDSIHERAGEHQQQRRLLGQVRGSPSATDTAVAVGSLDDHTTASSKAPSTPSDGPKYIGPPDDTDDAAESDWLLSRSDKDPDSVDADDLPSPGSGMPGIGAGLATRAAHSASPQGSDPGAYNTASSEFDTEAGDSVYRTPPTSLGDIAKSSASAQRNGSALAQNSRRSSRSGLGDEQDQQVVPSETPANTMNKLYLGDETYEHVPRRLTVESSSADPESIGEDEFETDEEIGLRAEISSPPGNVATESSERLVTHVENQFLLPPLAQSLKGRKCLVLDLDETLVHSSFREVEQPDYVVPVVLEGQEHSVYVVKRPGVDEFISVMGQYYEVVVFTASLAMYADPVLDLLDKKKVMHHRLFRESCNLYNGNYVKDLSRLGRDITQSIIIDNSPASYAFHPNNAIGISTWLNDQMDTELRDLIPFLIDLTTVDDVSAVLSLTHNHASFAHD